MKFRAIQVGVGGRGVSWSRGLQVSPRWTLTAIVDVHGPTLQDKGEALGIPPSARFGDYRQAFATVRADAAIVVTPIATHFPVARAALEAGLHVLVEKPLVTTLAEAHELIRVSEARGLWVMACQNYRYMPTTVALKQWLDAGQLGRPYAVRVDFYRHRPCRPDRRDEPSPQLFIQGVHHLDAMRYLFGGTPQSVFAWLQNPEHSSYRHESVVEALYRWPDGLVVSYGGSYVTQGETTGYGGLWRIECTRGAIYLRLTPEGERLFVATRPETTAEPVPLPGHLPMPEVVLLEDLAEAIATGRAPATSARDNLHTLAMIFGAIESSRTGRLVDLGPLTRVD